MRPILIVLIVAILTALCAPVINTRRPSIPEDIIYPKVSAPD